MLHSTAGLRINAGCVLPLVFLAILIFNLLNIIFTLLYTVCTVVQHYNVRPTVSISQHLIVSS